MSRRRHRGATPRDMEHWPRQYRPPRTRTRDFDFEADRARAKRVQCPRPPKGCGAPIGTTCRNRVTGDELVNLPACPARSAVADAADAAAPDQPELDQATQEAP